MASDDHGVGYKKPPERTRFKKGQSGNPKGRPKGSRNFRTALVEELSTTIPVTENGKRRKLAKRNVIAKQIVNAALAGDAKILKHIINADKADEERQSAAASQEFSIGPEDEKVIKGMIDRVLLAHGHAVPGPERKSHPGGEADQPDAENAGA